MSKIKGKTNRTSKKIGDKIKSKIKKGDEVVVITGKDKGKRGTVLSVEGQRLMVEGINIAKKHVKANPNSGEQGGIIDKTMSVHRSNVMLYDPISKKGSRVGIRILNDGKRERYFKASDQLVGSTESKV